MTVLRIIGRTFVLLAALLILLELGLWMAGYRLTDAAGKTWHAIDRESLNLVQALVQRYLYPELWTDFAVPMLLRQTWQAISLIALTFLLIGGLFLFGAFAMQPRKRRLFH